jgi:hypothetical protein
MTMGIVVVAFFAARTAGTILVTMRSTFRLTSSYAAAASRSICPAAQRYSMAMFRPSIQPRSRNA